jgi:hypothetical protein
VSETRALIAVGHRPRASHINLAPALHSKFRDRKADVSFGVVLTPGWPSHQGSGAGQSLIRGIDKGPPSGI